MFYKSHLLRQNESFKSQGDDFKLKHKSLEKSKNHLESISMLLDNENIVQAKVVHT